MFQCTSFVSNCFLLFNASISSSCTNQCARHGARLVGEQLVNFREKLLGLGQNWTTAADILYDHKRKTFLDGISNEPIILKPWLSTQVLSKTGQVFTTDREPLINDILVLSKHLLMKSYSKRLLTPFSSRLKHANGSLISGQFWCTTPQGHFFPHFGDDEAFGLEPTETYKKGVFLSFSLTSR